MSDRLTLERIAYLQLVGPGGLGGDDWKQLCAFAERYCQAEKLLGGVERTHPSVVVRKQARQLIAERALKAPRLTREQVCELTRWIVDVGGIGYSDSLRNRLQGYGIEVESAPPEAKV